MVRPEWALTFIPHILLHHTKYMLTSPSLPPQVHGEQRTLSDPGSHAGLQSLPDRLQFLDVPGGLGLLHDRRVQLALSTRGLLGQSGWTEGSQPRLVVFLLQGKTTVGQPSYQTGPLYDMRRLYILDHSLHGSPLYAIITQQSLYGIRSQSTASMKVLSGPFCLILGVLCTTVP